jgi:predicted metal-binding protein
LLKQLNTLVAERLQSDEFGIQPVACLWTCGQPCAVAFSAPHKPTYLFTNLPTDETASALLQFGKLYRDRKTGNVPWEQFPEALQSVSVAKIPAVGRVGNE